MNSEQIALPTENIQPADPSADVNDSDSRKRASFAEGMAASAFGRNCPHPDSYSFNDRRPGEIAIIRAARWPGAAR